MHDWGKNLVVRHQELTPIEFDGLSIIDYTAERETRSSFAEITVPAGVRHKRSQSTRSDKYYYVICGEVRFTIHDEVRLLSAGDFCLIPKGQWFSYSNSGSDEVKLILVHTPSFVLECEVFEE